MLALDDIVILSLSYHHNLVDTPLTSSSDGSDVQGDVITASLTGSTGINSLMLMGMFVLVGVLVMVVVGSVAGCLGIALVEGEGSPQVLPLPVRAGGGGTTGKQGKQGQTFESVHGWLNLYTSLQVMVTQALPNANCDPH